MDVKGRAVTLSAAGALAGGLLGVAGPAQAAEDVATLTAVEVTAVAPEGGELRQAGPGLAPTYAGQEPFAAENNQSYFYPGNSAYAFYVLYNKTPTQQPGLYLYNAPMARWYQRATLDQLPRQPMGPS